MDFPRDKSVVLFDGVCNLCSKAAQFIISQDNKDRFRFASLQGKIGQQFLHERRLNADDFDSIIFIVPGKAYYHKSQAILHIAKNLGGLWSLLFVFRVLPKSLLDLVYDWIARNRYSWFGKKESCMIPTKDLKAKFLDEIPDSDE